MILLAHWLFSGCGVFRAAEIWEWFGLQRAAPPHYTHHMDNERIREICLALPEKERAKLIRERKKQLAAQGEAKGR